jgi:hypothetical protein
MFNAELRTMGVYHFDIYKGIGKYFPLILIPINLFDVVIHIYLLYLIGAKYLLIIFLFIPSIFIFRILFGIMPYAQYVMPLLYILVAISFLNLLGFIHIPEISKINFIVWNNLS